MKPFSTSYCRITLLILFLSRSLISISQDSNSLKCTDVRNGTFYYYNQKDGDRETYTRKGGLQKEALPKRRETILWEVNWLNDCVYTLKYESGGENRPEAEQKILNKHVIATEILKVTGDYMVVRTALDKISNPTIFSDTLWIKQRQAQGGKPVTNLQADSLSTARMRAMDSIQATYATLYVYRPGKFLNSLKNYDLLIDGQPVCVISNGCREIVKLRKEGTVRISAKIYRTEEAVTLDVKSGGVYYLQCLCTWGIKSDPVLTIMDRKKGEAAFKTVEVNLIHRE